MIRLPPTEATKQAAVDAARQLSLDGLRRALEAGVSLTHRHTSGGYSLFGLVVSASERSFPRSADGDDDVRIAALNLLNECAGGLDKKNVEVALTHGRSPRVVQWFLDAGVDVSQLRYGSPVLNSVHRADVARQLIAAGAPVAAACDDGWTPLHVVLVLRGLDIAELLRALVDAGADVHTETPDGETPLDMAMRTAPELPHVVVRALEIGTDPAAGKGNGVGVLEYLVERLRARIAYRRTCISTDALGD